MFSSPFMLPPGSDVNDVIPTGLKGGVRRGGPERLRFGPPPEAPPAPAPPEPRRAGAGLRWLFFKRPLPAPAR